MWTTERHDFVDNFVDETEVVLHDHLSATASVIGDDAGEAAEQFEEDGRGHRLFGHEDEVELCVLNVGEVHVVQAEHWVWWRPLEDFVVEELDDRLGRLGKEATHRHWGTTVVAAKEILDEAHVEREVFLRKCIGLGR